MKAKLVVVGGKKAGMEIPISTPEVLIGRGDECHIRPLCTLVSHRHCVIYLEEGAGARGQGPEVRGQGATQRGTAFTIEDCGSANGTFVNGEKVKRRKLNDGDRIRIGTLEFEIKLPDDYEAEIAGWLEEGQSQDEDDDEHAQSVTVTPAKPTGHLDAHTGRMLAYTPATIRSPGSPARQSYAYKAEFGWDATDLLLISAIGILLVVVVGMLFPGTLSISPPRSFDGQPMPWGTWFWAQWRGLWYGSARPSWLWVAIVTMPLVILGSLWWVLKRKT